MFEVGDGTALHTGNARMRQITQKSHRLDLLLSRFP